MDEAFRIFKSTREYLMPTLKESAFLDSGMLTPEEFVRAGDHLVRTSPSWKWESGDKALIKAYLPENKQYLVIRGVPSFRRVSTLESSGLVQQDVSVGDANDSTWCDTHFAAPVTTQTQSEGSHQAAVESTSEYLDMEDESLALDSATATSAINNTMKVRRYDVSITYDNYYRTPRVWLAGYDENGSPLDTNAIFDDVMQDYAKRTVTIDPHPHTNRPQASVHPCQHASAMHSIVTAVQNSGSTPSPDLYLFYFLKFIQSVVPTIEYDYTMDVNVHSS